MLGKGRKQEPKPLDFFVVVKHPKAPRFSEAARTDFTFDESVPTGDAPKCPRCGAYVGMLESLPPFRVELETWGPQFGDCAFWLRSFLVSARFVEAYAVAELKGLSGFDRVEVLSHRAYGRARGTVPSYFHVVPKMGSARIDSHACGIERGPEKGEICSTCLGGGGEIKRWKHTILDTASWQGDDIFYPHGLSSTLVVSRRFKDWSDRHAFENLILVPSSEWSYDFYPLEDLHRN